MEHTLRTRHQPPPTSPSPRLVRSRSGAENHNSSNSLDHSQRFVNRSKSTTRSRNTKNEFENNINNLLTTPSLSRKQKKPSNSNQDNKDGFVRFMQRGSPRTSGTPKRPKSALGSTSPSAWALSPGRSAHKVVNSPVVEKMVKGNGEKVKAKSGGGMSGVLKYFRQKKVCPMQEVEFHKFRILHNRLLQWRLTNAKAEAKMASMNLIAQDKLFHVWVRILNMRNKLLEMRLENQKLKHEIKLCGIVNPQMKRLNQWAKLEVKNCEAVSRVTRKLSALSLKVPFDEDVKGDEKSIYEAMNEAIRVMDSIEVTIGEFLSQVEKKLYLLTELTSTIEHQSEMLEEMEKIVILVSKLLAWEKSSRVNLMQIVKESRQQCL